MKVKALNKKQKGMTLIEITLVIAILLGLISVLFIGIAAYKRGSDRAKCILTLSTVHKLAVSEANMTDLDVGDALDESFLLIKAYLTSPPECPDPDGGYQFAGVVTDSDTPYMECVLSLDARDHSYLNVAGPGPIPIP